VTDVITGEVNSRLAPDGVFSLTGSKVKIDGDNPAPEISLTIQSATEVVMIPKTSLLVNDPS
jgi:hypothetical protein